MDVKDPFHSFFIDNRGKSVPFDFFSKATIYVSAGGLKVVQNKAVIVYFCLLFCLLQDHDFRLIKINANMIISIIYYLQV